MASVTFPLPDSISESEARLLLAVKLFETGHISCGQASELAGYSKRAFVELLSKQGISIVNSPPDEVARDLANV